MISNRYFCNFILNINLEAEVQYVSGGCQRLCPAQMRSTISELAIIIVLSVAFLLSCLPLTIVGLIVEICSVG